MAKRKLIQSTKVEAASTSTVIEIEKPTKFTQYAPKKRSLYHTHTINWHSWLIQLTILIFILIIFSFTSLYWWYTSTFNKVAKYNLNQIVFNTYQQLKNSPNPINHLLILGIDQSVINRETSLLTDTLIIASINTQKTVTLTPIPRDLWIESLKTKVNSLYYYGEQNNQSDGLSLVSSVLSEITGLSIDSYILINMDIFKNIVDIFNGVDVNVLHSFEDNYYPKEIDLTSTDPSVLYQTIRFSQGLTHMDGDTALQYIRSRHSQDTIEGSDEGRSLRQQTVLLSLLSHLSKSSVFTNPYQMGTLFKLYKEQTKTNFTEANLLSTAIKLKFKQPKVDFVNLPITTASAEGVIYHPKEGPLKQWVYLPTDPTWNALKKWFNSVHQ